MQNLDNLLDLQRKISLQLTVVRKAIQAKHGLTRSPAIGFTVLNFRRQATSVPKCTTQKTKPMRTAPILSTSGSQIILRDNWAMYRGNASDSLWKPPSAHTSHDDNPIKKDEPNEAMCISHGGGNQNGLAKARYFRAEPKKNIVAMVNARGTISATLRDLSARLAMLIFLCLAAAVVVAAEAASALNWWWRFVEAIEKENVRSNK